MKSKPIKIPESRKNEIPMPRETPPNFPETLNVCPQVDIKITEKMKSFLLTGDPYHIEDMAPLPKKALLALYYQSYFA